MYLLVVMISRGIDILISGDVETHVLKLVTILRKPAK